MESTSKQTLPVLLLLLFLPGCVDLDTTNIDTKDYRSQVRFANLAVGVGDATSIRIDGEAYGSVAFAEAGAYKDIPAGSRSLSIVFSQIPETTYTKVFETDRKGTMFIVGSGPTVEHLFAIERYLFEAPGVSDGALVRVFHASPDVGSLRVAGSASGSPDYLTTGLPYKSATGYAKVAPSSYIFTLTSGADTLFKNVTYQFASNKRYTLTLFNRKAVLQQKLFVDD